MFSEPEVKFRNEAESILASGEHLTSVYQIFYIGVHTW